MKNSTFFKRTLTEINNLKKHATPEEIELLDFSKLNPDHEDKCIYGQMCGDCFNKRAVDLIHKSCRTQTSFIDLGELCEIPEEIKMKPRASMYPYFSYLEVCIKTFPHNNENIIKYLKGQIDTLELTNCKN